MGIIISPAVVPVVFALTWADCSAAGATIGAISGLFAGILSWICTALNDFGEVTKVSLDREWPLFTGNIVAALGSTIVCVGISLVWPQNFSWSDLKVSVALSEPDSRVPAEPEHVVLRLQRFTVWSGVVVSLVLLVVWPVLVLPARVFSEGYFTFWLALITIIALVAGGVMIAFPLYENWEEILQLLENMVDCRRTEKLLDTTGGSRLRGKSGSMHGPGSIPEATSLEQRVNQSGSRRAMRQEGTSYKSEVVYEAAANRGGTMVVRDPRDVEEDEREDLDDSSFHVI